MMLNDCPFSFEVACRLARIVWSAILDTESKNEGYPKVPNWDSHKLIPLNELKLPADVHDWICVSRTGDICRLTVEIAPKPIKYNYYKAMFYLREPDAEGKVLRSYDIVITGHTIINNRVSDEDIIERIRRLLKLKLDDLNSKVKLNVLESPDEILQIKDLYSFIPAVVEKRENAVLK